MLEVEFTGQCGHRVSETTTNQSPGRFKSIRQVYPSLVVRRSGSVVRRMNKVTLH